MSLLPAPCGNLPLPCPSGPACPASSPGLGNEEDSSSPGGTGFRQSTGQGRKETGEEGSLAEEGPQKDGSASGGRQGGSRGEPAESQEPSGSDVSPLRVVHRATGEALPTRPD